jgi:hypothetical protein
VKNVRSLGERQYLGQGLQEHEELLKREEESTDKDHREVEEFGKGLGHEDLAHLDSNKRKKFLTAGFQKYIQQDKI